MENLSCQNRNFKITVTEVNTMLREESSKHVTYQRYKFQQDTRHVDSEAQLGEFHATQSFVYDVTLSLH
jgi:ribosomal protein L23